MGWHKSHKEYAVPRWLDQHKVLQDWTRADGDVVFGVGDGKDGYAVKVYVDHPDPRQREYGAHRFYVFVPLYYRGVIDDDIEVLGSDDEQVVQRVVDWLLSELQSRAGEDLGERLASGSDVPFTEAGRPTVAGLPDLSDRRHAWGIPARNPVQDLKRRLMPSRW